MTSSKNLRASDINTGPDSPQASVNVWKSNGKRDTALIFLLLGMVFLVPPGMILLIVEGTKSLNAALVMILLGVGSMLLYIPLKKRGHEIYRLGLDRSTNTLWIDRPSAGGISFENDADKIEGFDIDKEDTNTGIIPFAVGDTFMVTGGKEREWGLMMQKSDAQGPMWVQGSRFATKKDAKAVLAKAGELLQLQER